MSGFTPIEFSKAATKEGGRLPTNDEKDADLQQVAAAFGSAPETKVDSANPGPQLIAGEASGSGMMKPESMAADLAASFDPTAAAGAINAVIAPPTSADGLEDGVEQMEVAYRNYAQVLWQLLMKETRFVPSMMDLGEVQMPTSRPTPTNALQPPQPWTASMAFTGCRHHRKNLATRNSPMHIGIGPNKMTSGCS